MTVAAIWATVSAAVVSVGGWVVPLFELAAASACDACGSVD